MFRGSAVDLPFALGINSLRASSLIHEFALFPLGINYYSIIGRAGCFQHTAIGIFPIVIHPITQGDDAFGAGGSQLDFAAFSVCPGGGISTGIRRSIDFNSMDGKIARRLDCYVVQIILKGSVCISRSFYIGTAGMDFAAYGYLTTIDIYTMIGINSTIIVFCCSILGVAGSHRTRTGINLDRIQSNRFTDIALERSASAAGLDIQAGIVQVGFLDEAYGGFPAYGSIIPGVVVAIADSQERSTVVRLTAATPAGPFGIAIDLTAIIVLLPVRTAGIPEFCSLDWNCSSVGFGISNRIRHQAFRTSNPVEAIWMRRICWSMGEDADLIVVLVPHTRSHTACP